MSVKAVAEEHFSEKLIGRWDQVCEKMQVLAEEIPATKFDYRAAETVRTVSEVLRHVAFWNQYVAVTVKGEKPDGTANEIPKEEFVTKAQILGALKRSSAEASKGLKEHAANLSAELAETVISFIEHNCEHYGQLAIYARLNGIVPPASRG